MFLGGCGSPCLAGVTWHLSQPEEKEPHRLAVAFFFHSFSPTFVLLVVSEKKKKVRRLMAAHGAGLASMTARLASMTARPPPATARQPSPARPREIAPPANL